MTGRNFNGGGVARKPRRDRRVLLWVILSVVCLASCLWLTSLFLERSARRRATENGAFKDFHDVTSEKLDRDVRAHIPLGSTRDFVEGFLTGQGMQFSFDARSQAIYAVARNLKGSNFIIETSLGFTFHFEGASRLTSIDSRVNLTGP